MHAATDQLDRVFRALGDPVRRRIIERLATGPAMVSELAEPFDISAPAITRHLKVLEAAGLLVRQKDGRIHRCQLDPEPMTAATNWIEFHRRFWARQFEQLEAFLHDTRPDAGPDTIPGPEPDAPDPRRPDSPDQTTTGNTKQPGKPRKRRTGR
ncbi:MAG: ArsR/SmtB family transcription factor [Planctomycetota bacterium]